MSEGMKGDDVLELEQNLSALGYFSREPDSEFLAPTTAAVQRWQKAMGLPETGVVTLSSVVFESGPVRIGKVTASLGASVEAGAAVSEVTAPTPSVLVKIPLASQGLASVSAAVSITLPNGTPTTGSVTSIGQPEAAPSKSGETGERVVPVEVALSDLASIGTIQEGPVTVNFTGERHDNVLAVPVDALLAQPGGGFAVESVTHGTKRKVIPVTTGLYQDALVEISGDGITEGITVVTAQS
ncbi:peptidoglycan-binding protein [Agreia pratensis]|uniref:peptidoglycan-binding protein n=1 Tax=Agreia pratensis TaxID=150121 RepID=UPI00188CC275|nr:peptidoglycan-binding protein [Agreia pratensis]MBF4636281.1 peptidoglycan-binding protein [Agreia pratensis]